MSKNPSGLTLHKKFLKNPSGLALHKEFPKNPSGLTLRKEFRILMYFESYFQLPAVEGNYVNFSLKISMYCN